MTKSFPKNLLRKGSFMDLYSSFFGRFNEPSGLVESGSL